MRRQLFSLAICLLVVVVLTSCAVHSTQPGMSPGLERIARTWNALPAEADSTALPVTIVYPRIAATDIVLAPGDSILEGSLPPDSLFLLGSVADPKGTLTINGTVIPVHPDGGWLAWVPRGPVETLIEANKIGPGRLAVVTIAYQNRSNSQTPYSRRILFLDKPDTSATPQESGYFPDTTYLMVNVPNAKIRCGWPGTYDMFPPEGTLLRSVGQQVSERSMWKVPLGNGTVGWIEDAHVEMLHDMFPVPMDVIHAVVGKVKETKWGRSTSEITIPLKIRRPFRVNQIADDRLELTIYGAMSWTDLIIQPHGSRAVDELRWTQLDSTTWKLIAYLDPAWFLGWETHFDDDHDLIWTIHETPEIQRQPLKGVRILLDPGHGGSDYSAIGSTGLPEKTANLRLARAVTRELQNAGAEVIPTRTEDITYGLYDRVVFANENQPDLCLSLHHNALAQGVRPFEHHGASVHYYHRHSHDLAESVYGAILNGGWPGHELRYQDLAMVRPSLCPAILIEAGFMMHPDEEALFRTERYNRDMARWIRTGLEGYMEDVRKEQRDD